MTAKKVYRAIGLMSGTSLDGVDAALIETDGYDYVRPIAFLCVPYEPALRDALRACFGKRDYDAGVRVAERLMTEAHIQAVKLLLGLNPPHPNPPPNGGRESEPEARTGGGARKAHIIGFHGQTITHDPANQFTFQIGDAAMLAKETGIDVVHDFRSADVKAGGQGAPLLPLYHRARVKAEKISEPVAILNIGGVANVTYIDGDDILAFDTGPGNALIDDWVNKYAGVNFDEDGKLATSGWISHLNLKILMMHKFFKKPPPKSLDRNELFPGPFKLAEKPSWFGKKFDVARGAATLTMFTVRSIQKSLDWLPQKPTQFIVCGGGRKNKFIMGQLQKNLGVPVKPSDEFGWNGDAIEAEGFGYLAVRSLLGEPISLPTTTGVPKPMTGGVYTRACP